MGLVNFVLGWRELGIRRGDLVLEVGSGGRPFARSDVLTDMFIEDSSERTVAPIVLDRPFVCANAEHLLHSGRTSVDLLPLMACSVCRGD